MALTEILAAQNMIALGSLKPQTEAVMELQAQLSRIGLLDPPADGLFGPVTEWALEAFCARFGAPVDGTLSAGSWDALRNAGDDEHFPLNLGADLASRLVRSVQAKGWWLNRHPDAMSILYVEGTDVSGAPNANEPNRFNDARFILGFAEGGRPELRGAWEGTTEPGRYWTIAPKDPRGAARIAFGQYKAWTVGTHHRGSPSAHEALVQAAPIKVYRDLARHYVREGQPYEGMFAINQHWGYDLPVGNLGNSSAGCLVGRTKWGHTQFMSLVKSDPRFHGNSGYRFMTAVMPAAWLLG